MNTPLEYHTKIRRHTVMDDKTRRIIYLRGEIENLTAEVESLKAKLSRLEYVTYQVIADLAGEYDSERKRAAIRKISDAVK